MRRDIEIFTSVVFLFILLMCTFTNVVTDVAIAWSKPHVESTMQSHRTIEVLDLRDTQE